MAIDINGLDDSNDNVLAKARHDQATYGIPERDYQAFRAQYHGAKRRKIPFNFSLLGWRLWWQVELTKIGPEAKRGKARDCYVMARIRDRGPYEAGNVRCVRPIDNARDRHPDDVARAVILQDQARQAPRGAHLKVRGDGHPKSLAVWTPAGRFGSIALAAEAYGITRAGASARVKRGFDGWYLDEVNP